MDRENAHIRLGIYFTAVNIGAVLVATLVLLKFGLISGIASFFGVVTLLTFLIQRKTARDLEDDSE
jgi:uncharacterized membrane protein YkgB